MISKASSIKSLLMRGLEELSLTYDESQISAFLTYLDELKRWNRTYNLTSLKRDEDIIIKHFLDSLLYLKALPEGGIELMDVGSGAGFPGVPIKIMRSDIRLYLVEPSRKKAGFLEHIVRTLRLEDVMVIDKRIEDVSGIKVEAALTRALFDIGEFYKKTIHLLKEDGILVLSKGPKVEEELKRGFHGDASLKILRVKLPLTKICRYIVIIYCASKDTYTTAGKTKKEPESISKKTNICFNLNCRLRKAGCRGFEGCPGFKVRA